jgi:hypothetical protein
MFYKKSIVEGNYESDNESDLDISWIKEQEKLQQINENYFKEPMEMIDVFFIYINTNDYIEKINYLQQNLIVIENDNSIIYNVDVINLIEKHKYLSNNKYKIQDVLLYNVSLNPENIQSYSKTDDLLKSSSKFLEPLSIVNDFIIPPSIFIFHKINSLFFIFKQVQEVKPMPKSILKPSVSIMDTNNDNTANANMVRDSNSNSDKRVIHKITKKVRIMDKEPITKLKMNNKFTRKQKK